MNSLKDINFKGKYVVLTIMICCIAASILLLCIPTVSKIIIYTITAAFDLSVIYSIIAIRSIKPYNTDYTPSLITLAVVALLVTLIII